MAEDPKPFPTPAAPANTAAAVVAAAPTRPGLAKVDVVTGPADPAEETAEYRLKPGFRHLGPKGQMEAGDTTLFNKRQAQAFSDKFEPVDGPAPGAAAAAAPPPATPPTPPTPTPHPPTAPLNVRIAEEKAAKAIADGAVSPQSQQSGGSNDAGGKK